MYKRRDWVFTHNPDGPQSSDVSDDDSASDSGSDESEVESVEDAANAGNQGALSAGDDSEGDGDSDSGPEEEEVAPGALQARIRARISAANADLDKGGDASGSESEAPDGEDVSGSESGGESDTNSVPEMDMEELQEMLEASDEEDIDFQGRRKRKRINSDLDGLTAQRVNWLTADMGSAVRGAPLRCLLCKHSLMLNAVTFKAHLTSKKHLKQVEKAGGLDEEEQIENIVWAEALLSDDLQAETHSERTSRYAQEQAKKDAIAARTPSSKKVKASSEDRSSDAEGKVAHKKEKIGKKDKSKGTVAEMPDAGSDVAATKAAVRDANGRIIKGDKKQKKVVKKVKDAEVKLKGDAEGGAAGAVNRKQRRAAERLAANTAAKGTGKAAAGKAKDAGKAQS